MLKPYGLILSLLAAPPLLAALAAPASAEPAHPALTQPLRVEHLDNGFTFVLVPFDSPGVVAYFTLVRAGSRDEVEPGRSGYAHLFEHLMFRGTPTVPAHEYEQHMQALGADNNAFTTSDYTFYTPLVSSDAISELAALDADRFQHLSYSRAAYKDETGAVLGEYNKVASSPTLPMEEALGALAFTKHTYGHTTLGWKRDVQAMPAAYDYSLSFFHRFYTPDDCTLFVVGDFDAAKVTSLVHAEYASWTGKRAETRVTPEPEQTTPRERAITWKGPTAPRLLEGFRIPAAAASLRDTAALAVVGSLVLGESSELYQRLVLDEQKLISLGFDAGDVLNRDPGLLLFEAKLKPVTSFDAIVQSVDEAFAKVGRGELSPEKVDAVRRHLASELLLGLETPQSVAGALARWTALTGDPHSLQAYADALAAVTPEDLTRVTKAYLIPSRRNVITLTAAAATTPEPIKSAKGTKGGAR